MGYKKLAMPLLFINTIAIAKMDAQVQQILYLHPAMENCLVLDRIVMIKMLDSIITDGIAQVVDKNIIGEE